MQHLPETTEQLEAWLSERIAEYLDIEVEDIETDKDIAHYGIDSLAKATLGADIEDLLGVQVPDEYFRDRHTVESLAEGLPELIAAGAAGARDTA